MCVYIRSRTQSIVRKKTKKLKNLLHSTKWERKFKSNFSRTHPRDATRNNGHRELKKML